VPRRRHLATPQVLASGLAPSVIYGAEHLLRLIIKMPELLPHTGASLEALQVLVARLEDLLTYMQVSAPSLFAAPSEYAPAAAALDGDKAGAAPPTATTTAGV
jgi:mortality factor 4-like protein 1